MFGSLLKRQKGLGNLGKPRLTIATSQLWS